MCHTKLFVRTFEISRSKNKALTVLTSLRSIRFLVVCDARNASSAKRNIILHYRVDQCIDAVTKLTKKGKLLHHTMRGSMVDIQSAAVRLGEEKRKKKERKKPHGKNIMACPIP